MKRMIVAAVLAATAAMTLTPPEAEARGRGFRIHVGGGFHRHRAFYAPVIYPAYPTYCGWYRSPYGPVKRCFY